MLLVMFSVDNYAENNIVLCSQSAIYPAYIDGQTDLTLR